MNAVADNIALMCAELSETHLAAVVDACRECAFYDPATRSALRAVVPGPHRPVIEPFLDSWAAEPTLPGVAVAVAVESVKAAARRANAPEVSVVCTGPDSVLAPVRLTSQVVLQLVNAANERVTISSFSSYKIPSVMAALDAARDRGARVDLILESQEHLRHGGGAETFEGYQVFVWPQAKRPPNARLHAKAVVVDSRDVLLTSANLSNAAFNSNLELGVLIRGGTVAQSIQRHFDALIAAGTLSSDTA